MPNKKKDDTEKIADRVDMKTLDKEVLDAEFRKGAKLGILIGATIFALSILLGYE